jgi:hypothetical protein
MRIKELLEVQAWERFKGNLSSRVWFNTRTGEAVTSNDDNNHSASTVINKDFFGITDEDLARVGVQPGEQILDYDGRVLFATMQKGWVRIYVDARAPDLNSNAEGLDLGGLRRAFIWYCEQIGTPKRFVLVLRTGAGDKEGTPHVLADADQIEWFIRKGSLPHERFPKDQPAQVKQVDTTPHMFKRISG